MRLLDPTITLASTSVSFGGPSWQRKQSARQPRHLARRSTSITEPRAAVVERLSHGKVPGEAVKTLARCDASHFQLADWTALFAQLGDAKTRRALSHVTDVTTTLARQLDAIPAGLRLPSILELLVALHDLRQ